ncbi:cation efflux protein, CzcI family [Piscinibacter terrae]|uniref:Cobalt-zinc-cadmium resistance protein n=1 Tax=Piscinibacter terrae TaxID=2496871 RepID=A0A3N7HMJ0_9BURK|nr:cation efflux protein, CzcI family [Albitalea terrae]RQP21851.1 hypothetical protein DZC73_25770 [Albitalea terrae]
MRRWLVVLLLVVLPFQFAWTAAAAYCGHETSASVKHFGHHVHVHKAATGSVDAKHAGGTAAPDLDCPVCHLGAPALPAEFAVVDVSIPPAEFAAPDAAAPPSAIAEAPERPNWLLAV